MAGLIRHGNCADSKRRDLDQHVFYGRSNGDNRILVTFPHDVVDRQCQPPSNLTSWMVHGELVHRNVLQLHQGDGDRIAYGKSRSGARRRSQIQRAGLARYRQTKDDIGKFRHRRSGARGNRNDHVAVSLKNAQQGIQFLTLAALADRKHDIPRSDHSDVAMHGFRGVEKNGRCSRTSKCGGNLRADDAGFANSRDTDLTVTSGDDFDRLFECIGEVLPHGPQGIGFDVEDLRDLFQDFHGLSLFLTMNNRLRIPSRHGSSLFSPIRWE
jgi:hypothetical protein